MSCYSSLWFLLCIIWTWTCENLICLTLAEMMLLGKVTMLFLWLPSSTVGEYGLGLDFLCFSSIMLISILSVVISSHVPPFISVTRFPNHLAGELSFPLCFAYFLVGCGFCIFVLFYYLILNLFSILFHFLIYTFLDSFDWYILWLFYNRCILIWFILELFYVYGYLSMCFTNFNI